MRTTLKYCKEIPLEQIETLIKDNNITWLYLEEDGDIGANELETVVEDPNIIFIDT